MLHYDDDREIDRCVGVFLQWSFTLKNDNEYFSAAADAALPSYEEGGTYQELAVRSWSYYFDSREMQNIKKQVEGEYYDRRNCR